MSTFLFAWNLLTTIRLGNTKNAIDLPGRSAGWFPFIGLVLGAILTLTDYVSGRLFTGLTSPALVLVAWVLLTGGLHLDGFIDCCDGLLPSVSPDRRMEILKDSRVGAFGVLGAFCLLLLKFSAIATLPWPARGTWLLLAPCLSRWLMVWTAWRYPLARPEGFAAWFRRGLGKRQVVFAAAFSLAAALLLASWMGVFAYLSEWNNSYGYRIRGNAPHTWRDWRCIWSSQRGDRNLRPAASGWAAKCPQLSVNHPTRRRYFPGSIEMTKPIVILKTMIMLKT